MMNPLSYQPLESPVLPVIGLDWQFSIRPSPLHGLGLFAKRDFDDGEIITMLDGQQITIADMAAIRKKILNHRVASDIVEHITMEFNYLGDCKILARPFRTIYGYMNHSRNPNCVLSDTPSLCVRTLSAIQPGVELTIDYRKEPLPREYLTKHGSSYL